MSTTRRFKRSAENHKPERLNSGQTKLKIPAKIDLTNLLIDPEKTIELCASIINWRNNCQSREDFAKVTKIIKDFRVAIYDCDYTIDIWMNFLKTYKTQLLSSSSETSIAPLLFGSAEGDLEHSKKILSLLCNLFYLDSNQIKNFQISNDSAIQFVIDFLFFSHQSCTWSNITGAINDDSEVKELFGQFLGIFFMYGIFPKPVTYTFWKKRRREIGAYNAILREKTFSTDGNVSHWGLLPVDDKHFTTVLNYFKELEEKLTPYETAFDELLNIFQSNLDDFAKKFETMLSDIRNNASCWVRPAGKDTVKLNIKELSCSISSTTKIQFFSEGNKFPALKIRFWRKQFGRYHKLEYKINENTLLVNFRGSGNLPDSDPRVLMDKLYIYVAVHCLHRIVIRPDVEKVKNYNESGYVNTSTRKINMKKSLTEVRPYFRNLPAGSQPSEQAQLNAIELFDMLPPDGKTFVRAHARKLTVEYQLTEKEESLFTYTNNDLGIFVI